jgi:hypothetical protein
MGQRLLRGRPRRASACQPESRIGRQGYRLAGSDPIGELLANLLRQVPPQTNDAGIALVLDVLSHELARRGGRARPPCREGALQRGVHPRAYIAALKLRLVKQVPHAHPFAMTAAGILRAATARSSPASLLPRPIGLDTCDRHPLQSDVAGDGLVKRSTSTAARMLRQESARYSRRGIPHASAKSSAFSRRSPMRPVAGHQRLSSARISTRRRRAATSVMPMSTNSPSAMASVRRSSCSRRAAISSAAGALGPFHCAIHAT